MRDHTIIPLPYCRLTSRKQRGGQYLDEMIEGLQLREVLARYAAAVAGADSQRPARHYLTAYMAAAESSQHKLSKDYQTVDLRVLTQGSAGSVGILNQHLVQRSMQLRSWNSLLDGAISLLQQRLREFTLGDQVGYGQEYQRIVRRQGLPDLHTYVIQVHNSAVLAADVPWNDQHFVLQTVHANASFHHKPFFDYVAVRMSDDDAAPVLDYAQLLLLFQAQLPDHESCDVAWQPLAYVRWFNKESSRGDVLSSYGGVPLSWDMVARDPATRLTGHRCSIIHLKSIYKREYVAPEFKEGTSALSDRFYVNPFKY